MPATFGNRIARLFDLTDSSAWARHANPWSGWTRLTVPPLLVVAFWSRTWLGGWALVPISAALLWTWLNPRAFPPPASYDSWMSRGVLGERRWLAGGLAGLPQHHRVVPRLLAGLSVFGTLMTVWGVIRLAIAPTLLGLVVLYLAKLWFIDRMVWLHERLEGESNGTRTGYHARDTDGAGP